MRYVYRVWILILFLLHGFFVCVCVKRKIAYICTILEFHTKRIYCDVITFSDQMQWYNQSFIYINNVDVGGDKKYMPNVIIFNMPCTQLFTLCEASRRIFALLFVFVIGISLPHLQPFHIIMPNKKRSVCGDANVICLCSCSVTIDLIHNSSTT